MGGLAWVFVGFVLFVEAAEAVLGWFVGLNRSFTDVR